MTTYHLAAAIVIDSTNNTIIFHEDGGATDRTATVASGTYYFYGDGSEATDILTAVETALNAGTGVGATYTINNVGITPTSTTTVYTYDISTSSTSISIRGAHGSTTFPLAAIGFSATNTAFGEPSPDVAPTHAWVAEQPSVLLDIDGSDGAVKQHRTPSGRKYTFAISDPMERRVLEWRFVAQVRVLDEYGSTLPTRSLQSFWALIRTGLQFRVDKLDAETFCSSSTLVDLYVLSEEDCSKFRVDRNDQRSPFYDIRWTAEEYVA